MAHFSTVKSFIPDTVCLILKAESPTCDFASIRKEVKRKCQPVEMLKSVVSHCEFIENLGFQAEWLRHPPKFGQEFSEMI